MTSAVESVTELVLRERQSRDRGWWVEFAACYAEDAVVDISWIKGTGADFVRETVARSKNGVWGRHRLCPPLVRVNEDRAWVELPLAVEFRIDVNGVEADLISFARSQYRCCRLNDAWRIVRFESVYERDTLTPAVPGTSLDLRAVDFAGYRSAYRCLAWYLDRNGSTVAEDMPGDDRPDTVAQFYESARQWLADGAA